MPLKGGARVRETSQTTGVGAYTLLGAPAGFQPFSVIGAGNLCRYTVTDGIGFEEGIGTVRVGPNQLERTHVLQSSNAGAAVNWGVGTRTLRCGPISDLDLPRVLSKNVAGGAGTTVLTQDEQRRSAIEFTGALTGNRTIEVDATPWSWIIYNNTSGAFSLTVKVTGQVGVAVQQGGWVVLYCDGVDVRGTNYLPLGGGTLTGALTLAAAGVSFPAGMTANGMLLHGQCRLTKSGANLLLSPFNGNKLILNSKLESVPDAGVTLGAGGLVAGTNYYIYAYMNAGVMTLEASATAPATQAGTGVKIKNGDATRTLVGFARPITGPAWADSDAQRLVRTWFNDPGLASSNAVTSDQSTSSTSFVEIGTGFRIEWLGWDGEASMVAHTGEASNNFAGSTAHVGLGVDGTVQTRTSHQPGNNGYLSTVAPMWAFKQAGDAYRYMNAYIATNNGAAATTLISASGAHNKLMTGGSGC